MAIFNVFQLNRIKDLSMQRLKFLAGTVVFVLILIALAAVAYSPSFTSDSKDLASKDLPQNTSIDQRASALYKWKQQELRVAVKEYFDRAIASGYIVGAGVSIVIGDSIVMADGFGKRNVDRNKEVNGQTIFRLGSLSKGFTGILAADLKAEGKLRWEDKVSDYIPGFKLGYGGNLNKITLANILSHTSGAPYHSYTNLVEAGLPLTDIARRFYKVEPISKPGSIYSYQNALFALSGEMMCVSTDQPFSTSLISRFFDPLEMCSTTMDHETLVNSENVAVPHSKRRNRWQSKKITNRYYNAIAAGGINASAADMAKWIRFLLGYHPEILSKSALAEAFKPQIEIKGRSKYYQRWPGHLSSYYGFGWRIHKFTEEVTEQEKTIWHHGGSVNDYRNEIAVYPEANLGICVLLNNNSKLAKTVIPDLYKIVQKVYKKTTINLAYNDEPLALEAMATSNPVH